MKRESGEELSTVRCEEGPPLKQNITELSSHYTAVPPGGERRRVMVKMEVRK
jgi:hypothetical protein